MKILVTGAAGMIGKSLVKGLLDKGYDVLSLDRRESSQPGAVSIVADLGDGALLKKIVEENGVDRIIHLAALAHTAGEDDLSYEKYFHVNVECAKNVFSAARDIPVLFISTVDVYGFTKGVVNGESEPRPVTPYGKTKALAEAECKNICKNYTIFRFAPVYTQDIKRDIQKRYYLKYPNLAYIIGKGTEYEVLDINHAVECMVAWCGEDAKNNIINIKDARRMNTKDYVCAEKTEGRAKYVLRLPRWIVCFGFSCIKAITGENKYTYLLNKAVNPLRTE